MSRSQDPESSLVLEQSGLQILFSFKTGIMGVSYRKKHEKVYDYFKISTQ